MSALTFEHLREVNVRRRGRWHDDADAEPWSGADWSNAMAGEAGEACNVVKKLRRQETGLRGAKDPDTSVLVEMLGDELADTLIYLDLLADFYGIDLAQAVVRKFNIVSDREGFPDWLVVDG